MSEVKPHESNGAPDLNTICRLCLEPQTGKVNIFDSGRLSIPVRIMACASLEVQQTDDLPKLICEPCRFQLEKSYYFRQKCQLSNAKLRKHIRLLNAGRRSRVFLKSNDDDYDEDEEEQLLQESLKFICEEEEKIRKEEEERRLQWLSEQQEQFRKEETQRLFEEFGNFVNSRKPVEKPTSSKFENVEYGIREVLPEKAEEKVFPSKQISKEYHIKRPRMKIMPRKTREQFIKTETEVEVETEAEPENENEITSSEQIPEEQEQQHEQEQEQEQEQDQEPEQEQEQEPEHEQEQMLIYNDEEAENADGTIQTFLFYGKSGDEESSQIIEIESETFDGFEEELNREDDDDTEEAHMDADTNEDDETEDFIFATEYEECDNRDEEANQNSVNVVESYQIEENGEIQYLKEETHPETLSVSDEEEVQNILDSAEIPQYQIEQSIVLPPSKHKLKRKAPDSNSDTHHEKKLHTPNSPMISVNYAKISTEDLKIFKCSDCPQSFTRETSLLRHRSAHKKGREYSCNKCDKWFSCKSSLDRHMRIHTGEKPFTCEQCGKSYMQKEVLKRHLAIHSGERPHPCPHCPRAFVQKLMLTQHINATHLEVPQIQKHDCHLCSKSFHHASGLSRHLITHSGMKFRCSECGRSFNDKSSIRRHVMSVHSKAKDKTTIQTTRVSPNNDTEYVL